MNIEEAKSVAQHLRRIAGKYDTYDYHEETEQDAATTIDALIAEVERLTKVDVEPHQGCACRWDADDNRVATCVRHQGWLDVVQEWADRARGAESALAAEQAKVREMQLVVDACNKSVDTCHKAMEVYDAAFDEWMDKTAWTVKKVKPKELGMHRADIARQRFEAEQAKVRELVALLEGICDMQDANEGYASVAAYDKARAAIAKYGDKND